jgi:glycosyltransferase involved in cell wall biosynthesis
VDPVEFEVEDASEARYLTMINPVPIKGIGTALRVAARLPEQRFLVVESWPLDGRALAAIERVLAHLPNVRFIRRQVDMREVYGQTRILLVPSAWEEAGARVVREAQLSGIPAIVSRRGGLPEAAGAGAIVIDDPFDTDAWVAAIQSLTDDPARLRALGDAARAHAHSADYSAAVNVERFLHACRAAQDAATRTPT